MSTHSYVGVRIDQPGQVRLRYVHLDGYLSYMIPTLRKIWAGAADKNTDRLATLLLAYDWDYLDPEMTDGSNSLPLAGEQLIRGVGMTLAATRGDGMVLPPDPARVVALTATGDLDAQWIYLLEPGTDTVAVHSIGGDRVATEALTS